MKAGAAVVLLKILLVVPVIAVFKPVTPVAALLVVPENKNYLDPHTLLTWIKNKNTTIKIHFHMLFYGTCILNNVILVINTFRTANETFSFLACHRQHPQTKNFRS